MARSRSNSKNIRRDASAIANTRRVLPLKFDFSRLTELQDRRAFNPEDVYASPRSIQGTRSRIRSSRVVAATAQSSPNRARMPKMRFKVTYAFQSPKRVLVCIRRRARKEVLHALKKTGRRGQRSPRFNYYSSIRC